MSDFAVAFVFGTVWFFGVARVTRLVTRDMITEPLRVWLIAHSGKFNVWAADFLTCPWCVSFWVALSASPIVVETLDTSYRWAVVFALATSYVVGIVSQIEDYDDTEIDIEDDQ